MSYYKNKEDRKKAVSKKKIVPKNEEVEVAEPEHDIIDEFILVLRGDMKNVAIVKFEYALLVMMPMLYLCNWNDSFQVATTLGICLNTVVRTQFPSQYCPACASKPGVLYHPITARAIAVVTEMLMYKARADWIHQPIYGGWTFGTIHLLGWIGIIGEIVCLAQLGLQSEFLNVCEDTIWAIQAAVECYYAINNTQFVIFGLFASYLFIYHLPRMA
jgi:hypothetical protein